MYREVNFRKASNVLIFKDRLMCLGLCISTRYQCLRVSSFSIFLRDMSASVSSLLHNSLQSLQLVVSFFTVSL